MIEPKQIYYQHKTNLKIQILFESELKKGLWYVGLKENDDIIISAYVDKKEINENWELQSNSHSKPKK